MQLTTPALVLREQPVGESGKILTLLTREEGILRAFAHGARKPGGALTAPCSLFAYSQFQLKSSKDAWNVSSAEVLRLFRGVHTDVEKLALVSYFTEVAGYLVSPDETAAQYLRLMLNCIAFLCEERREPELIKAVYELKAMELAGYMPDIVGCHDCLTYTASAMFYLPQSGTLCCGDCISKHPEAVRISLTPGALTAIRHIVLTEFDRIFAFAISAESVHILSRVAELYLLHRIALPLPTLQFYHALFPEQPSGEA